MPGRRQHGARRRDVSAARHHVVDEDDLADVLHRNDPKLRRQDGGVARSPFTGRLDRRPPAQQREDVRAHPAGSERFRERGIEVVHAADRDFLGHGVGMSGHRDDLDRSPLVLGEDPFAELLNRPRHGWLTVAGVDPLLHAANGDRRMPVERQALHGA